MKTTVAPLILTVLAGCLMQASAITGSSGSSPTTSGNITVPNVFGLRKDQAIAELRRAGFQGNVGEDSSLCGSVVEGRVIELGVVCYQHPPAGRVQGNRLSISLRVQTEDPWHGNPGKVTEWHLMPNIVGMSIEQARAEMKRVGFDRDDRVLLDWVDEPGCRPLTVCKTYPEAMTRAGVHSDKIVSVARDPDAKPAPTAARPDPATKPDPAVRPDPAAKPEAKPEPFF